MSCLIFTNIIVLLEVYRSVDLWKFASPVVRQTLRSSSDPQRRRACLDPAGAEGEALPGDHMLFGQGQGEH